MLLALTSIFPLQQLLLIPFIALVIIPILFIDVLSLIWPILQLLLANDSLQPHLPPFQFKHQFPFIIILMLTDFDHLHLVSFMQYLPAFLELQ